jgi:hypothetical protein
MPEKQTVEAAERDREEGKAPSTQAGEFVKEEIHHVREGKHGARSSKQAIAIGLSKARRAGVKLPAPKRGKGSTRKKASQDLARAGKRTRSPTRSRATKGALKREGRSAASRGALARQAKGAASRRSATDRSRAAKQAARTKGPRVRSAAAKKAARSRKRR